MLNKDEIQLALSAATEALETEEGVSWVNDSALTHRAYLYGLYFALRPFASEDDLGQIISEAVSSTLFRRQRDDPFLSTTLGRSFERLKSALLNPAQAKEDDQNRQLGSEFGGNAMQRAEACLYAQKRICELLESAFKLHRAFIEASQMEGAKEDPRMSLFRCVDEIEHFARELAASRQGE